MNDTLTVPVTASFKVVKGEPVMVSAEYAQVSAAAIAKILAPAFMAQKGATNHGEH